MSSENPHKKKGLTRFINSAKNSVSGLKLCFQEEEAFRLEIYATCILAPWIYYIELSFEYKIYLVFSIALVWMIELLNSAVEAVVDMVTLDFHILAKKAKDIASAAVFISLLHAGMAIAIGVYKLYLQ